MLCRVFIAASPPSNATRADLISENSLFTNKIGVFDSLVSAIMLFWISSVSSFIDTTIAAISL